MSIITSCTECHARVSMCDHVEEAHRKTLRALRGEIADLKLRLALAENDVAAPCKGCGATAASGFAHSPSCQERR